MSVTLNFDATAVTPNAVYEPVPSGWYKCVIIESIEKPTKAQDGSYLQLTLQIIEGDHAGKKLFERLNLNNPNQTAVDIANRTLSAICHAVAVLHPKVSGDLHDRPMMVKVSVKPAGNGFDAGNEIKGYESTQDHKAPPVATGAAVKATTPAWKR